MIIITDTREQLPMFGNRKETLIVGDYTTTKLKNKFHIERKTLQDLYGTLVAGNPRFKAELFRAAYHQIKIEMYIEGTHDDFVNKRFPNGEERQFTTEGLIKMVKTFEKKYYLKFNWFKNRKECKAAVEKRLLKEENKLKSK
jgi:ERCC4-type nuclease